MEKKYSKQENKIVINVKKIKKIILMEKKGK